MSGIGPELPPHLLAKRKRQQEEEPRNAPTRASGAKSPSPDGAEKRRRVIGPAMPPAPLDERPSEPASAPVARQDSSDDDSDDGYGPALPSGPGVADTEDDNNETTAPRPDTTPAEEKLRRDDWMMMPPKQDDLAARMDPTKIRARGFNTGKGAKAPNPQGDDSSAWHETPEQKRKRLADEMMGVAKPSSADPVAASKSGKSAKDEAAARRIKEHMEKNRGPSLVEQHKARGGDEAEDDPSKRAFDREKDMGMGMRFSGAQKEEMLKKSAGGFSSKFSGGGYL